MSHTGGKALRSPFVAFPGMLAGNWIVAGIAKTQTDSQYGFLTAARSGGFSISTLFNCFEGI